MLKTGEQTDLVEMNSLLLSLAIILVGTISVQAQFSCFTAPNCTDGENITESSNADDCCVNNPAGMFFTNGGECFQCIVYGWGLDSFSRPESQTPYMIPLAYSKGPPAMIFLDIIDNQEGTAERNIDYTENENGVLFLSLDPARTTSVTFRPDNFALEMDETIEFELEVINSPFDNSLPNVFFQRRIELTVEDSTGLEFRLREVDRSEREDNGVIEIVVEVANQRDLASSIFLILTPRVALESFTPKPSTTPFDRASTHSSGRDDFSTDPITLHFPIGRTREVIGNVTIFDDLINEALEYFVVVLSFADPDNMPSTVSIEGTGVIRCDIVDNDDIFIGFQLPNATYPEMEASHAVTIIKGAGNVTEQIITVVINMIETVPPGTSFDTATPTEDLAFGTSSTSLVRSIAPDASEITILVTLFEDTEPENTEAAQLTLELPTDIIGGGTPPRFEILPEFPNFFVIIDDDDLFVLGFENTSYTVDEGVGFQEVCVRIFEPRDDVTIRVNLLVALETVVDTADETDYTPTDRFDTVLTFNDDTRRSCGNIMITDDLVYENQERFSLRLGDLGGSLGLPRNLVMSPNASEIIILDNEMVTVGFIGAPYSAREDEGPMIFTVGVTSNHTLERDIVLSFSTADSTQTDMAIADVDYTAVDGMQIILNGNMMTVDVAVDLINDSDFEPDEIFRGLLILTSGERVSVGTDSADATIIDDEIACQDLGDLENGRIVYSRNSTAPHLEGTVAMHFCFPGFVLVGERIRVCQNDTRFSGVPPVCIPIGCPPLPMIDNGVIIYSTALTPENNYGLVTVATYICNGGFRLDLAEGGSETRTCVDDMDNDAEGVFDRQAPRCVPTGFTVNDTLSGDPLYTAPINVPDKSSIMNVGPNDPINLCFEIHGEDNALLNLVSDTCVSVNARYAMVRPMENINIVDRIYVRATGSDGICRNIEVSLNQCSAFVDSVAVNDFVSAGISVRRFRNRVRIMVPNCADIDLVMWVSCINTTFWSTLSTDELEVTFSAPNIRFTIARGLDLAERSHGLLGQFWNVPIQVERYTGPVRDGANCDSCYVITTNHPDEPPRSFVGWLYPLTWEYRREYCLYAGGNQAGPLYEILDDSMNSPVIFGTYTDYMVAEPYATDFNYSHFEESRCGEEETPQ